MPLTATIAPAAQRRGRGRHAASRALRARAGARRDRASAQRRAAARAGVGLGVEAAVGGSSYSARQRAHIAKPAIVVSGRS